MFYTYLSLILSYFHHPNRYLPSLDPQSSRCLFSNKITTALLPNKMINEPILLGRCNTSLSFAMAPLYSAAIKMVTLLDMICCTVVHHNQRGYCKERAERN